MRGAEDPATAARPARARTPVSPMAVASALVAAGCCALLMTCELARAAAPDEPRVFLLDPLQLRRHETGAQNPALVKLLAEARSARAIKPFSVVNKEILPPSGDKHDYMSRAPYWWPNPNTPDGLPYVQRDGERNPEIRKIPNRDDLRSLIETVETLSLAYHFDRDEANAAKAAELLRAWFLDAETRMNPNLQFAQGIPGINTGRGIGIIESWMFAKIVDCVGLIESSDAWTDADQRGLTKWMADYLKWLLESDPGRAEAAEKNNHGTHYDVQVVSLALFTDQPEIARKVLQAVGERRIAQQIDPDGRQPLETRRTRSFHYSVFNLSGLMNLARLGEHVGVDLWSFQTSDGRSIRKALDYLAPFALGQQKWPYQLIDGWDPAELYPLLYRASLKYPDGTYAEAVAALLPSIDPADRNRLLFSHLADVGRRKP